MLTLTTTGLVVGACSRTSVTSSAEPDPVELPPPTAAGTDNAGSETTVLNPALTPPVPTSLAFSEMPLTVEAVVAFLDGCATTADSIGPCQCALERLEEGFTMGDLAIFEDRMTGRLQYSPQIAGALVSCREATEQQVWEQDARARYIDACTKGAEELSELCTCSVARAQAVVPERHLEAFIGSADVQPGFTDLIGTCL